jgi:hypothetical protein
LYGLVLSKLRSDHCDVESLTLFDVPMFGAHILIIPRSFIINFEGLFAPCIVCLPIYIYTCGQHVGWVHVSRHPVHGTYLRIPYT